MAKILLVEDDDELAKKITSWLELEHHFVEWTNRGKDAVERLEFFQFDLVVLDWQLPELEGIEILEHFRNRGGKTPVLMLTGKAELQDKMKGLDSGADDYLTKPFHPKELTARVRALLRRNTAVYDDVLRAGSLELNTVSHRVTVQGNEVKLQPKEFALLEFLLRNPKDVFSVEALLNRIWPSDSDASPDTVRVCITRLRNKINVEGSPPIIRTVHRLGYQIEGADSK
jgi:DNA-binding response OmpR family regulator